MENEEKSSLETLNDAVGIPKPQNKKQEPQKC